MTHSAAKTPVAEAAIASALRTLEVEHDGLGQLKAALGGAMAQPFARAVQALVAARGRVIITGIGKSGHVGQKIAATMASTGTPAHFVHATEASHGDLGMVTPEDAIVALSWSGETVELGSIITYSRRFLVPLIAMTSNAASTLGSQADVVLELPKAKEACAHVPAPTTSTTMQLALGDALAVALLEAKGFSAQEFKVRHPGGKLGASLKYVRDLMHGAAEMPLVGETLLVSDALLVMTAKSFGCLGVTDAEGRLVGMITDGDLRRHMSARLLAMKATDIMTRMPDTLLPGTLASAALEHFNSKKRTQMFVVEHGLPVGILHVHDLLRAGVA